MGFCFDTILIYSNYFFQPDQLLPVPLLGLHSAPTGALSQVFQSVLVSDQAH